MAKMAYIEHPCFEKHNPGTGHPESPQRLTAVREYLEENGFFSRIQRIQSRAATMDNLERIHDTEYIKYILELKGVESHVVDGGDTILNSHSVEAALLAAGAAELAVDLIFKEHYDKVFAAVRPPGHHAEAGKAMGFCLFNNIALAAKYAQAVYGIKQVLIVDFDVHHGNGTQNSFYEDDTVFYLSLHRYPFYPGSGAEKESGRGKGAGYTINHPLPLGSGDSEFTGKLEASLLKIEETIQPELILISAGFDAHLDDHLGGMRVSDKGFYKMTEIIARFARKQASGRVISFLEGGYNQQALARNVYQHLHCLLKH